ncbi:protein kinase [Nocardia sp. NPDC058058]|uniref:serine/threonine-protein kinase n=1 Tax=Nocardia sp. NPDC058058 TaxID=3346317 RepID=UPI0036DF1DD6
MALAAGSVFAGFTIDILLGAGGMGEVYRARHPRLPRMVALKVLSDTTAGDPSFRARFDREADLAAGLNHRNIVTIHDRGVEAERPWICMEYVPGTDVAHAIKQQPDGLNPARAVHILAEAARGIDHAHANGLLHRDIKPANILLSHGDPGELERVVVSDFGIARRVDQSTALTETGTFVATLAYAAPEIFTGDPVDHRTDLYALGATLYEMLTGTVPYPRTTPAAVLHAHLMQPPPKVTAHNPALPRELDDIIARALAKSPAERFGTARELATSVAGSLSRPQPFRSPTQPPRPTPPQATIVGRQPTSPSRPPARTSPAPNSLPGRTPPPVGATPPQPPRTTLEQGRIAPPPPAEAARRDRSHAASNAPPTRTPVDPEPAAPPGRSESSAVAAGQGSGRRRSRIGPSYRLAIISLAVVLILTLGILVLYTAARRDYYIAEDNGAVVIERGRPGSVLGMSWHSPELIGCVTAAGELTLSATASGFPAGCRALRITDLTASGRNSLQQGLPRGSLVDATKRLQALVTGELLPTCENAHAPGGLAPAPTGSATTTRSVVPTAPPLGSAPTTSGSPAPVTPGQNCRTTG